MRGKMGKQLHKMFSTQEVIGVLKKYVSKEIDVEMGMRLLKIQRRQFFNLLKNYKEEPAQFSIAYERKKATNRLDKKIEELLQKELKKERGLIENKDTPIKNYNYSYIQQRLLEKEGIQVSLPTIIDRAKKKWVLPKKITKEKS